MAHIFISYHHSDRRFVEALESQLRDADIQTWSDPQVRPGESWREAIDDAIRDAAALVVVMSPAAKASQYVNYEWAFALGANIKVIPLLLGLMPEELHPRLAHRQALDFTDRHNRRWDMLFLALGPSTPGPRAARGGAAPVVEQAARALGSLVEEERIQAIETLVQIEDPAAKQVLAEQGLTHAVRDVRMRAAFALRQLKDVRAVPGLLEVVRIQAAHYTQAFPWVDGSLLAEFGPPAVPDLIRALEDADHCVRWAAAAALGTLGDDAALPALIEEVRSEYPQMRSNVVYLLGGFGTRAPVRLIADCLADESVDVQDKAVDALGKIGGPEAVAALTAVVTGTSSWTIRAKAASVLGRLGDRAAVPALVALLNSDSSERECKAAAEALARIGGGEAVAALVEVLARKGFENRAVAASALEEAGAVPALAAALRDDNEGVRTRAARALAQIATPEAKAALAAAGTSKSGRSKRHYA